MRAAPDPRASVAQAEMGIAEQIYEIAKGLPEDVAREILEFAKRRRALAILDKYAGTVKRVKYKREELYDRPCLR